VQVNDPEDTQELRKSQLKREMAEAELASSAVDEEELLQHQRRAEKAQYLRQKLEEREASETQG
jgi:hypothetical protein